jgi:predicted metalloprotease
VLRAFILAAVAAIGLSPITGLAASSNPPRDALVWAEKQIDGYYRTLFALEGKSDEYVAPTTTFTDGKETVRTACGAFTGPMLAFYCPADQQIVMSTDIIEWAEERDDFVPVYILAHEWAHHVQSLSGTMPVTMPTSGDWDLVYTIENELRADCMAGAWMRNVANRGYLNASDMSGVLATANEIGGGGLYGRPHSHGQGVERLRAVFMGYEEGIMGCMSIAPLDVRIPTV